MIDVSWLSGVGATVFDIGIPRAVVILLPSIQGSE